jgi:oxygen-dependent protoporphyrinogen oxidase
VWISTIVIAIAMHDTFQFAPDLQGIYGFFVPKKERDVISAIGIEALKDKQRIAGGHLLNIFLSGKAGQGMIDWKEEAILPVVLNELDKYFADHGLRDSMGHRRGFAEAGRGYFA